MANEDQNSGVRWWFDKLVIPVLLAGVAAILTFVGGPFVTQKWQTRAHNFDTETALVNELSLASAQLMSAVQTREFAPEREQPAAYLSAFRSWDTESQVIDAKIAIYFKQGQALAKGWRDFEEAMRLYHNLADQPNDKTPRQLTLRHLLTYAGLSRQRVPALRQRPANASTSVTYQADWVRLKRALIASRDAFVAKLNASSMRD